MRYILFLILGLSFISCATVKKGNLYDLKVNRVSILAKDIKVKVADVRHVDEGEVRIPTLSFPGQDFSHKKKLDIKTLISIVTDQFTIDRREVTKSYHLIVDVKKANQRFKASSVKEHESVSVLVNVKMLNDNNVSCDESKEINGTTSSIDASNEYIDKMLYDAFGLAVRSALSTCQSKL